MVKYHSDENTSDEIFLTVKILARFIISTFVLIYETV